MQARQLEKMLARHTARTMADLEIRGRKLREAMMIPVTGRGPHAAEIDAATAAKMLIAVAGTNVASSAADAVVKFASLRELRDYTGFAGASTFGDALTSMLSKPELANMVNRVTFLRLYSEDADNKYGADVAVKCEWRGSDGTDQYALYVPEDQIEHMTQPGFRDDRLGSSRIVDAQIIGGGLLHQIAIDLEDKNEGAILAAGREPC